MIDPAMVIAYAEEHNRVDMITRFVIARALRDACLAVAIDPAFKIAVNISALDLRDPAFVGQLQTMLEAERFPVGNLVLEITETARIADFITQGLKAGRAYLSRNGFPKNFKTNRGWRVHGS